MRTENFVVFPERAGFGFFHLNLALWHASRRTFLLFWRRKAEGGWLSLHDSLPSSNTCAKAALGCLIDSSQTNQNCLLSEHCFFALFITNFSKDYVKIYSSVADCMCHNISFAPCADLCYFKVVVGLKLLQRAHLCRNTMKKSLPEGAFSAW